MYYVYPICRGVSRGKEMLKGEGGECPAGANRGVSPLLKLNEFLVFTLCCLHPEILQDVHLDIVSY